MIRVLLVAFALLSPFLFPYPMTLVLSFAASLFLPPLAFVVGVVVDLIYFVPVPNTVPLPVATIAGALISIAAYAVRRFVRARVVPFSLP